MVGKKQSLACANAAARSLPNASERARNRASPSAVVKLYPDLNDGQKGAIVDLDLTSMLDIKCKSLHNPVINWLAPLYDKFSKEFVIPGRGRIPLNPDSVRHTLGLPHGELHVPYSTDFLIVDRLAPIIFPNACSTPKISEVCKELKVMKDCGEIFKQMFTMYLVCTLLAPTTCNRVSSRCYPIMDKWADVPRMGFCKFVCDKLHEELSSGNFSSACLFHLQLLYVDSLDVSGIGITLPEGQFVVNKWSKEDINKVLLADLKRDGSGYGNLELKPHLAINLRWFGGAAGFEQWIETNTSANCSKQRQRKVSKLIANFAAGMTGLLSSLVQGLTEMDATDDAEIEEQLDTVCRDLCVRGPSDNVRVKKKAQPGVQPASGDENLAIGTSPALMQASTVSSPTMKNVQSTTSQAGTVSGTVDTRASPVVLSPITRSKSLAASNVSAPQGAPVRLSPATRSAAKGIKLGRKGIDAPEIVESESGRIFAKDFSSESDDDDDSDYVDENDADQYIILSRKQFGGLAENPLTDGPRAESAVTDFVVPSDGNINQYPDLNKLGGRASLEHQPFLVVPDIEKNNDSEMHVDTAAQQPEKELNSSKNHVEDLRNESLIAKPSKCSEPFMKRKLRSSLKGDMASNTSARTKSAIHGKGAANSPPRKLRKFGVKRGTNVMKNQGVRSSPRFSAKQPVQDGVTKAGLSVKSDGLESSNLTAATSNDGAKVPVDVPVSDKLLPGAPEVAGEPLKSVFIEEGRMNEVDAVVPPPFACSDIETTIPATAPKCWVNASGVVEKGSVTLNGEADGIKDYFAGSGSSTVQSNEAVLNAGAMPMGGNATSVVQAQKVDSTLAEKPNERTASSSRPIGKVDCVAVVNSSTANVSSDAQSDETAKDNPRFIEPMVLDDIAANIASASDGVPCDRTDLSENPPVQEASTFVQENLSIKYEEVETVTVRASSIPDPDIELLYVTPAMPPPPVQLSIGSNTPRTKLRMGRVVFPSKYLLPPYSKIVSSEEQDTLYQQVIKHHSDSEKSKIKGWTILHIEPMWVYLGDLASSVMPNGQLSGTVAEIGISVLQQQCPKKKIIFPWIVTVYLLEKKFSSKILQTHFRRDRNYKLSHQELLSFAVFQELGTKNKPCGHWYMLSLNFQSKRFEVLDSLRGPDDESLVSHANSLVDSIKAMYRVNYSDSAKQIDNYELEYIDAPKQGPTLNCGFFMLKFLELWNGRLVPAITNDQIEELRKVLTWTWLNHPSNKITNWKLFLDSNIL